MCGRFTLAVETSELQTAFPFLNVPESTQLAPRYNVAPTQDVAVVANNGEHTLEMFHWGLIPGWAKDTSIRNRMINARAETLAEKPSFRAAYKRRRCLILADGFYEWRKDAGGKKTPMYIQLKSREPFAFAGLWEVWHADQDDQILSCTIITTTPNALMEKIHDRMPVILDPQHYEQWLDAGEQTPDTLDKLLKPFAASKMKAYAVSTAVNRPANDSLANIAPVAQ